MVDNIFPRDLVKLVFSLPTQSNYQKVVVRPVEKQGEPLFLFEQFTETQVFHKNLGYQDARQEAEALAAVFRQINAFTAEKEVMVKISKKGKRLISEKPLQQAAKAPATHNRSKQYLLQEGVAVPALVELGVLTAEGRVVAARYHKWKQINRYLEFIDDVVSKWGKGSIRIVDFGCGKSYLTFVLYHYLTEIRGIQAQIVGLDLKKDVVAHCQKLAETFGYTGLQFLCCDIKDYAPTEAVDMVVSLHACDTATDYALYNAMTWGAEYIFAVPCCQHELNGSLQGGAYALMQEYGLVKERFAALATDTLRAKLLTAGGYETQLLEFIDLEHSPKNILIRAKKKNLHPSKRQQAREQAAVFLQDSGGKCTLWELLEKDWVKK